MVKFAYSYHSSKEKAEAALEDYFSTGEVSNGDGPVIKRFNAKCWAVMLNG